MLSRREKRDAQNNAPSPPNLTATATRTGALCAQTMDRRSAALPVQELAATDRLGNSVARIPPGSRCPEEESNLYALAGRRV